MGYAGGHKANPTYHALGDHTEVLQVWFDPDRLGYDALLQIFWDRHDPTSPRRSTQYRPLIIAVDDAQRRAAQASRDDLETRLGERVTTEVVSDRPFYPAEGYHQKWRLRRHTAVLEDLQACFPTEAEMLASAAAAKLNAFIGGRGDPDGLAQLLPKLGLSAEGQAAFERTLTQ